MKTIAARRLYHPWNEITNWFRGLDERMIYGGSLLEQLFTLIILMKHLILLRALQAAGVWAYPGPVVDENFLEPTFVGFFLSFRRILSFLLSSLPYFRPCSSILNLFHSIFSSSYAPISAPYLKKIYLHDKTILYYRTPKHVTLR